MLRVVQHDKRQAIYDGLCAIAESARTKPFAFLKLVEMIGDRTEDKPTQHITTEQRRQTIFTLDATPSPVDKEAAAVVEPGIAPVVDLASPPISPPSTLPLSILPAQPLVVLPPPA